MIKIYYNKNIQFLDQNLVDKVIKTGQIIKKSKRYNLIFKKAITNLKSNFLFIIF